MSLLPSFHFDIAVSLHCAVADSVRTNLILQNLVFKDASSPTSGPVVQSVAVDMWTPSWGTYHLGYGSTNVCNSFPCIGIRVTFDKPLTLVEDPQGVHAYDGGFEVFNAAESVWMPVSLTGLWPGDSKHM